MKNIAIGVLMVILLAILVEPMVEIANVCREKIMLGTALTNACRAAKDRSLEYLKLRDLDAKIDEARFVEYFSEAFGAAMNATKESENGNTLTFASKSDNFNDFTVTLNLSNYIDSQTLQEVTKVEASAEAKYKFKTKYLKLAEQQSGSLNYMLTGERVYFVSIKN